MNRYLKISFSIIFVIFLSSCKTPVQEEIEETTDPYKEVFISANTYTKDRQQEHIAAFVERVGWKMKRTATGLWYMFEEEGVGPRAEEGKFISYTYETRLIDGTFCYGADTTAPKKIVLGKGNIESGLEEGLLLLREGSRARFIIPSYLAHGNLGDRKKIPGLSILIVEVNVLDIKR